MSGTYVSSRYGRGFNGCPNNVDDVDEVVVDRLIAGFVVRSSTPAERAAAIDHLLGYGMTGREIAERTGLTIRTVQRHLARMRAHNNDTSNVRRSA